jgi:hypothetical protein
MGGSSIMDWNAVWKIVLGVVTSIGGISFIILAVIKFSSDIIAERLSKKYELKLAKEMEIYKAGLENKVYISKAKFDTEFLLYRQLSITFVNMVKDSSQLFPRFTKDGCDDYDKYKRLHDKSVDSIVAAQDELYSSAPFVTQNLYDDFNEIVNICKTQLSDFQDFRLRIDAEEYRKDCKEAYKAVYKRTAEIADKYDLLLIKVREYINQLDVID